MRRRLSWHRDRCSGEWSSADISAVKVLHPGSPPAGEVRPVIGRHHEHVVKTREAARIGQPLLAAQAVDGLAAQLFGNLVTPRASLAPLEVLAAATPESPALRTLIRPSSPRTAGKSGSQF
jgi:hypothetical protein